MSESDDAARVLGSWRPVAREELTGASPLVAADLVGRLLVRAGPDGFQRAGEPAPEAVARIVETEAYRQDDPASHSHRGRTPRTEPMFARPGTAYVYRSYGVHWCLNVSVEEEGRGAAVLLRAARLLLGHPVVRSRRPTARADRDLLRGPGCLTAGLDVDGPRHDGGDLLDGGAGLLLADDGWRPGADRLRTTPRVGIRHAADVPWRVHLVDEPAVSAYRSHPRVVRPD